MVNRIQNSKPVIPSTLGNHMNYIKKYVKNYQLNDYKG